MLLQPPLSLSSLRVLFFSLIPSLYLSRSSVYLLCLSSLTVLIVTLLSLLLSIYLACYVDNSHHNSSSFFVCKKPSSLPLTHTHHAECMYAAASICACFSMCVFCAALCCGVGRVGWRGAGLAPTAFFPVVTMVSRGFALIDKKRG